MKYSSWKMFAFTQAFVLLVWAAFAPAQVARPARPATRASSNFSELQQTSDSAMSIWQARSIILERLPRILSNHKRDMGNGIREDRYMKISAVQVSGYKIKYEYSWTEQEDGFGFHPAATSGQSTTTLDLKKIGPVWEVVNSGWAPDTGGRRPGIFTYSSSSPYVCTGYCLIDRNKQSYVDSMFMWSSSQDASLLAQAMNRLSAYALGKRTPEEEAVWSNFPQKAAAWRALTVKPPLSDEVRKHRILAEKAISEQDITGALEHYEAGLAINPVWPEGHFNAGMLYAQLSFYNDAIQHMKAYLELVPEAPDAQAVRDQMVIWEDALKKAE
jgi:tetratricopeptide (TPR) repeat protein